MTPRAKRVLCSFLATFAAIASTGLAQEPVEEPREIRVGLLMVDLIEVKGAEQAFSADIVMAASWQDPDLADASQGTRSFDLDDIWHPVLLISNRRSVTEVMPREVTVQPDGTVGYMQRFTGLFSVPMDLREFPRDDQEFFVWVVSPIKAGQSITLVREDSLPVLRSEKLSVSDWDIGEASLTLEPFQIAPEAPLNPGIKLSVPGNRRVTYYIIQVLIPLLAIVMMAYAVFWVAPAVVPTRVGVVVTTMLTLIAYRFMLANHVPRLPYLTRLDWFMLGATVVVILTLFTMAGTAYLMSRDQEAVVKKIDRAGRLLYPIAFVFFTVVAWLT